MTKQTKIWITQQNAAEKKAELGAAIASMIEKGCTVTVSPHRETRRQLQSRLSQVWKKDYGDGIGEKNLVSVWGGWKLYYLLDLKLADPDTAKTARREKRLVKATVELMKQDPDFDPSELHVSYLEAADAIIRSSEGVSVQMFAEWLSAIQSMAAENGVVLRSNKDDEMRALMLDEADKRSKAA